MDRRVEIESVSQIILLNQSNSDYNLNKEKTAESTPAKTAESKLYKTAESEPAKTAESRSEETEESTRDITDQPISQKTAELAKHLMHSAESKTESTSESEYELKSAAESISILGEKTTIFTNQGANYQIHSEFEGSTRFEELRILAPPPTPANELDSHFGYDSHSVPATIHEHKHLTCLIHEYEPTKCSIHEHEPTLASSIHEHEPTPSYFNHELAANKSKVNHGFEI